MKLTYLKYLPLYLTLTLLSQLGFANETSASKDTRQKSCPDYLNVKLKKLHSSEHINLCTLYKKDKPILVVNTASHCGYTKQFKELEALHQKYKNKQLLVLGFPSHAFKQEAKDESETAGICYKNYGVTFPMFAPVDIKGDKAIDLFKYLTAKSQAPSWNFNKYLIAKSGEVSHFPSSIKPMDSALEKAVKVSF